MGGSVAEADLLTRIIVVALLALAFTFGVYGIVAAIVKMDDAGLWLSEREGDGAGAQRLIGRLLLGAAPKLMKLLAIVGTIAMLKRSEKNKRKRGKKKDKESNREKGKKK